jgi:type II secretory ATPase GspE/PulE/Tfp pilus assembly ATPase PilB-like protein
MSWWKKEPPKAPAAPPRPVAPSHPIAPRTVHPSIGALTRLHSAAPAALPAGGSTGADGVVPIHERVLTRKGERLYQDDRSSRFAALLVRSGEKAVHLLEATGVQAHESLSFRALLREPPGYVVIAVTKVSVRQIEQLNGVQATAGPATAVAGTRGLISPLLVRWEEILEQAVSLDASDVHIEVRTDSPCRVRFRTGGDMVEMPHLLEGPKQLLDLAGFLYNNLCQGGSNQAFNSRGVSSAEMTEREVRDVRNGHARRVRGRVQTLRVNGPDLHMDGGTVAPMDLVLRILFSDQDVVPTLEELGYLPSQVAAFERAVAFKTGLFSISGQVGAGKSTTLRALFDRLPAYWKKFSFEDPVEYRHANTTQVLVQRDLTSKADSEAVFRTNLLAIKRGDLNALLLGEIRDADTMAAARDVVLSGHPVFTTVHAQSALGQVPRLLIPELGLSRSDLADPSFINTLAHQALVKRLCPHCTLTGPEAVAALGADYLIAIERKFHVDPKRFRARNPRGCGHCQGTRHTDLYGYSGREVVAEWFQPDMEDRDLILKGDQVNLWRRWRATRTAAFHEEDTCGKEALEVGLYKSLQGIFDPRSVEDKFRPFSLHIVSEERSTGVVPLPHGVRR